MTKIIHGDLVLKKDIRFDESVVIEGNITCDDSSNRYSLFVDGDILAENIYVRNISALSIRAQNINAMDISVVKNIYADDIYSASINADEVDAWDINATGDVDVDFILCESLKQQKGSKLITKHIITRRRYYEQKERKIRKTD